MRFKITYQYDNGSFEYEYKTFNDWSGAEHYAEKECINRKAKEYYIT